MHAARGCHVCRRATAYRFQPVCCACIGTVEGRFQTVVGECRRRYLREPPPCYAERWKQRVAGADPRLTAVPGQSGKERDARDTRNEADLHPTLDAVPCVSDGDRDTGRAMPWKKSGQL